MTNNDYYDCWAFNCNCFSDDGVPFCMYFKTHRTNKGCPTLQKYRDEVMKLNKKWEEENKMMNEAADSFVAENKEEVCKEVSKVSTKCDKAFDTERRKSELREKIPYSRLYKIARKMHEWIFLNTVDHEAVFKEIGLTPEENEYLGDLGSIRITL